jgi:hypothetical protein
MQNFVIYSAKSDSGVAMKWWKDTIKVPPAN